MRRGKNEGSVCRRKSDGRWIAVVHVGWLDGRRRRKYLYGLTQKEVLEKKAKFEKKLVRTLAFHSAEKITVGAYLDRWIETRISEWSPSTAQRYQQIVSRFLKPLFGSIILSRLTPFHIEDSFGRILKQGTGSGTVRKCHEVLGSALSRATRLGVLDANPILRVQKAKPSNERRALLTLEQWRTLLAEAAKIRLSALIMMAALTGMRQGELLGLSWSDVDLEVGELHVRQCLWENSAGECILKEPKSKTSRRTCFLPVVLLQSVQQHREAMAKEGHNVVNGAVFVTRAGDWIRRSNLIADVWRPLLKRAKVPKIRFHDLRHLYATLLLGNGISIRDVSEQLGHSDPALTMRTYAHVLQDHKRKAADSMDKLFG